MKIVFKFNFILLATLGLLLGAATTVVHTAHANGTYFTKRSILKEFFPGSEKVTFATYEPDARERALVSKRLGYPLAKQKYYFFVATTAGVIDGYAFMDDQMGQHQPITFAVKLSPDGTVLREEIMVYRESHGDEVRNARFARQFQGKTLNSPLQANVDIDCISGATISSRAITVGVRRALVLFDAAVTAKIPQRVTASGQGSSN